MKPLVRVLALTAILGFTALSTAHATATVNACRYFCGGMIRQTNVISCCAQTFTCPNGQNVQAYGYLGINGWQFC